MGLFDSVISAVSSQVAQQGGIAQVVSGLLANNGELGGLNGLVEKFNQAGLGDVVASWISNNTNLPISAEQIQSVLGQGPLQDVASKMGLSSGDVASALSERLPGLVDQLTPNGQLPSGDLMAQGLGMLKGFMKS